MGRGGLFYRPEGRFLSTEVIMKYVISGSPLDKLISCKINAGTKVVIGNGQSAACSDYLSYPASSARQIYIQDALQNLTRCKVYTGVFKWKS